MTTSLAQQARGQALGGAGSRRHVLVDTPGGFEGGTVDAIRMRAYYPPSRELWDVTDFLLSFNLADDQEVAALSGSATFDNGDGQVGLVLNRPGMIFFLETKAAGKSFVERKRFVAWETEATDLTHGQLTVEMYDHLIYPHSLVIDAHYVVDKRHPKGWYAHEIAADLCKRAKIPVAGLVKTNYRIRRFVVKEASVLDMIVKAYYVDSRKTKNYYYVVSDKGRLRVRRSKKRSMILALDERYNLRAGSFRRALPDTFASTVIPKGGTADPSTGNRNQHSVVTRATPSKTEKSSAGSLKGLTKTGKASWYGGPNDSQDNNKPASGIPNTTAGIAVYNQATLKGYWRVTDPKGTTKVLQQTDIGPAPSTNCIVDINYTAVKLFGYTERSFPTKEGNWRITYLGADASGVASSSSSSKTTKKRLASALLLGNLTYRPRSFSVGDPEWTRLDAQELSDRLSRAVKTLTLEVDGNMMLEVGDRVFVRMTTAAGRPMRKEVFVSAVSHSFTPGDFVSSVTCRWRELDVAVKADLQDLEKADSDSSSSTTTAKKGKYSKADLVELAAAHGFPDPNLAAAVAMGESGGDPNSRNHNTNGTVDLGLWQINSVHKQYDQAKLLEPDYNAEAAKGISNGGQTWQPWVAYTNGSYTKYL